MAKHYATQLDCGCWLIKKQVVRVIGCPEHDPNPPARPPHPNTMAGK